MESNIYSLSSEYWNNIKENNQEVYAKFIKWLDDYKLRINWSAKMKANVDFFDLPIDMQHGIVSRFFFEAGEIGSQLIESQKRWLDYTKYMFDQLEKRLQELNN